MEIILPAGFGVSHAAAVLKFLAGESMTPAERAAMLQAFDVLGQAWVRDETGERTFAAIYEEVVEQAYADDFLASLLTPDELREATARRAAVGREIMATLAQRGWLLPDVAEARLLAAYCRYWWSAFARGYTFEAQVYRDLEQSGITFQAHDIRDRRQRFSAYDLIVLGYLGDVKVSVYFLDAARTSALQSDFYVTQLSTPGGQAHWVVFLKPHVWESIDGKTIDCLLTEVLSVLPQPARIQSGQTVFIVADYTVWKEKVRVRQTLRKEGE